MVEIKPFKGTRPYNEDAKNLIAPSTDHLSIENIEIFKKNNYWIYGFDSLKNNNSNLNFSKKSVLVFGSEGKGIRELVKKECDEIIQINMKNNLKFEIDSLNVSNATSIALYQFYST